VTTVMLPVERMLRKMRRVWLLERCTRGVLLILGLAADGCLLCLVLNRALGLPLASMAALALLTALAVAALVTQARLAAPSAALLARLLDQRAGTRDLFASALEFEREPGRFGSLGALTCDLACSRAATLALRPRRLLGSPGSWVAVGSATALLLAVYAGAVAIGPLRRGPSADAARSALPPPKRDETAKLPEEKEPADAVQETVLPALKEPAPEAAVEPAIKITNEMVDKYLAQMPADQDVDLTGVTPVRWDGDEASGKDNPQNQPAPEKIDPVKLDAALLKDLQDAKKKKDEAGGKEGGVDIAVMSEAGGTKVKGKEGGKEGGESLANAVSKDPRGEPTRMASKPARKAIQVRSASRTLSKQKGEELPMGLLDFLAALEQLKAAPSAKPDATPLATSHSEDRVVRHEPLGDAAAALIEAYFGRLRKADR